MADDIPQGANGGPTIGWRVYETVAVRYGVEPSYSWEAWTQSGRANGEAKTLPVAEARASRAFRDLLAAARGGKHG